MSNPSVECEDDLTPDDFLSPSQQNILLQDMNSQSPSLLQWGFFSDSSAEDLFEMSEANNGQGCTAIEISPVEASSLKDEHGSLFLEDQTRDFTALSNVYKTSEEESCSIPEKTMSADLFVQSQGMILPLHEISDQDIADILGVVDDCSPDLFSETSDDSLSIPSRDHYMEEEAILAKMVEKQRQEKYDRNIAMLLSKGIDATQKRPLRGSQKPNEV